MGVLMSCLVGVLRGYVCMEGVKEVGMLRG